MYSEEDFYELVKEHVQKLNKEWFQKKEKLFKESKDYDLLKEKIVSKIEVVSWSTLIEDENEEEELCITEITPNVTTETILIDLRKYCASYLPIDEMTFWGTFPLDAYSYVSRVSNSNNIHEFAESLIEVAHPLIKGNTDNFVIHTFVSKFIDLVQKEITVLKQDELSETHTEVLTDFLNFFIKKIYHKYQRELTLFALTNDSKDTLEFTLNQDQLVSLLFIIQRAGFLKYTEISPILQFCLNHFLYTGERDEIKSPTSLRILQKKFSDVATSQSKTSTENHTGLRFVEKKLSAIIERLK